MAGDFKRMKLTGKDKVWGLVLAAVMLSYFIWDFRGSGALIMLAITPSILLALSFAVPRQYRPHIISILAVGMGGTIALALSTYSAFMVPICTDRVRGSRTMNR